MKILSTVRLDSQDYQAICMLGKKRKMKKSEVIRQAIHNGLLHLINGEEENALIARRLSRKTTDVDGSTFLAHLNKQLGI